MNIVQTGYAKYRESHFDEFLDNLLKIDAPDLASALALELSNLVEEFHNDRLTPIDIGWFIKKICALKVPKAEDERSSGTYSAAIHDLSDIGWDLCDSDSWPAYYSCLGKIDNTIRKLRLGGGSSSQQHVSISDSPATVRPNRPIDTGSANDLI